MPVAPALGDIDIGAQVSHFDDRATAGEVIDEESESAIYGSGRRQRSLVSCGLERHFAGSSHFVTQYLMNSGRGSYFLCCSKC